MPLSQLQRLRVWHWYLAGRSIAFANGCFDLLHPGHLSLLRVAYSSCAKVVVAVDTSASVRRLKGPGRPVQPLAVRLAALKATGIVDLVVPFDDDDELLELIRFIKPIVLIKGDDWRGRIVVGAHLARHVFFVPLVNGWSTSRLVADPGKS